jgi:hypothetical protein
MGMGLRLVALAGLAVLGACTRPVDDPLAVHSIYWGLAPMPEYRGELPTVLFSAPDTPARQGLLYTAMVEAEVAAQYAGRAMAAEDDTAVRGALGEVLYAIDPAEAPEWGAKGTGIVSGWAGQGYGLRRAAGGMAGEIRAAVAEGDGPALAEYGPAAAVCADNTLARADQIVALVHRTLDAAAIQTEQLLRQIRDLADELHRGGGSPPDAPAPDPDCGLQQAEGYLDRVALRSS